jgi:hypothetical protein
LPDHSYREFTSCYRLRSAMKVDWLEAGSVHTTMPPFLSSTSKKSDFGRMSKLREEATLCPKMRQIVWFQRQWAWDPHSMWSQHSFQQLLIPACGKGLLPLFDRKLQLYPTGINPRPKIRLASSLSRGRGTATECSFQSEHSWEFFIFWAHWGPRQTCQVLHSSHPREAAIWSKAFPPWPFPLLPTPARTILFLFSSCWATPEFKNIDHVSHMPLVPK